MELRHLRYFVAVAEELHFHRAADRLAMAQPPLSQQIRNLEAELGVVLFERAHRRVRLTAAGCIFLEDAREILARSEWAVRRLRRADRGELGHLTVGYTSLLHYPFFREVLRLYRDRYPEVEITLRDMVTIEQMQRLHANTLDISFAAYASFALTSLTRKELAHECILREPVVAVLPTDHRLARHVPIPLTALAGEPWIWFARPFDPMTYDYMMRLFEQAGFRPTVTQEVNQAQLFIDLVAAGMGVSLVPASAARPEGDGVVYLPIAEPAPTVEFDIVWRRDDTSPLVRAFIGVVRDTATGAPGGEDALP